MMITEIKSLPSFEPNSWRPVRHQPALKAPQKAEERFFFGKKEDHSHEEYYDYHPDYDYGYHHHFLDRDANEEYSDYTEKNDDFSIATFVGNLFNWTN